MIETAVNNNDPLFRIVFLGTPGFAAYCLRVIADAGFNVVGVVTAPDRPAGRGLHLHQSEVKKTAVELNLQVLQPEKLRSPEFIMQLSDLKADLFVVVAFRMLPEEVFTLPPKGTINLHASLLPDYRGAAPINHVIINGEITTGVTTFFIEKQIDTGKIIYREAVDISEKEYAGSLHDKLMIHGANLLVKTLNAIKSGDYPRQDQTVYFSVENELKTAPRIFTSDCRIDWKKDVAAVYDFIRGLSPDPAAFTEITDNKGTRLLLKIFETDKSSEHHGHQPGTILTDGKTFMNITTKDGYLNIKELQISGKKRMSIKDFLRGFKIENYFIQ
ncbi:MAG: methionyl-tRNA formyltransferase [Bacteroidia bacterium]|nr:methionyl-tRNA formyltransferase [Bacteroidia bacterium]